jgi:Zn finger protein HypA/HybF involved in hydrogenase expression
MHDKTLILPIVEELKKSFLQDIKVEIQVGNFTNLDNETIKEFLHNTDPEVFTLEKLNLLNFSHLIGSVLCFDCGYVGKNSKIIQDPALHLNSIVPCPACDSLQTKKIEGNKIEIISQK